MRKISLYTVAVCSLVLVSRMAMAAEHPLEAFPENTGLVVRMKTPQATLKKVADFAAKADPSWKPFFDRGAEQIGKLVYNTKLEGIDVKGDWYVAVFPSHDGDPGVVFAVPVSDAATAQKATGDGFQYVTYQNWLLYSEQKETLELVQKRVKGQGKSIVPVIDRESRGVVDRADFGVFVNVKQLRETYKNEIETLKKQAEAGLKQLQQMPSQAPGINMGAAFAVYEDLFHGVMQGLDDSSGFTFAASIGDQSLSLEQFLKVSADSPTDKFFQSNAPAAISVLDKLPAGKLGYFGVHGNSAGMMEWGLKMSTAMFEGNAEAKKATEAAAAELAKVKIGSYAFTFSVGDPKEGALRASMVTEVDQPEKLREIYRNMPQALSKVEGLPFKQEVKVEKDAEKYGERSADIVTVKQEFSESLDPLGIQKKMMEAMYGPGGMVSRAVLLKGSVAQTMGGGKPEMEELLKSLDGSGSLSDSRGAIRRELSKEANFLGLIDLPGLAVKVLSLVSEGGSFPIPIDGEGLKKLDLKRSYLGFSVATERQGLRVKTQVPLEQLQGVAKLAQFFTGRKL